MSGDEFRRRLLNPNRRLANYRERPHNGILGLLVLFQRCQGMVERTVASFAMLGVHADGTRLRAKTACSPKACLPG